jgi:CRP-like cAMP-binding protein
VAGDLLGRPENGRYVNSAETVGPAKLYRIAWQRMQQLMLAEPQLQLHLLMKVADDFRQAERRIMTLGQQNTCQRLASFILDLLRLPEFFDEKRSLLKLPVNRFDLADYLGTVTKSSERAFARLESQGFVRRVTSRTIEILDIDGLQLLQREQRHGHP